MSKLANPIKLLYSIKSELRMAFPEGTSLSRAQPVVYILSQFKKNTTTQEQHCKHKEEMTYMAETYLTYLSKYK